MKLSEAMRLRGIIEQAADQGLSDETALTVPALFPSWNSTAAYDKGQRVRHEAVLYRCLLSHTAQADWTPSLAPSLWARVLMENETAVPEWVQPDSVNPYAKGDRVKHGGKTWESAIDGNVWEPGVYGWEVVA